MATDTLKRMPLDMANLAEADRPVFDWLTRRFGAPPIEFCRLLRWRPGWEAVVEIEGRPHGVFVRPERGKGYESPVSLEMESRIHDVMERHGVRAPHSYGMIDDPVAFVMEKLPGGINSELIPDEDDRWKVRREFIDALAKLHAIPVEEFGTVGLPVPDDLKRGSLAYYKRAITIVRKLVHDRPMPYLEFLEKWLERHCPADRDRVSLVTADSGQFMYEGNRFTGLIDFELAYIGDPAAEFAAFRVRDSAEPLGDIGRLRDYYESITGDHIDYKLIAYHSAGFCGTAGLLTWPIAYECDPSVDWVAYLQFSIVMARWGLQGMLESMGMRSEPLADPKANSVMPYSGATVHHMGLMTSWKTDDQALQYHFEGGAALAAYMEKCLVYGHDILMADLADIGTLVGRTVGTRDEADRVLCEWIRTTTADDDAALVRFFDRWFQRQNFLLKGCGSQEFFTRLDLQSIAMRPDDER